MGPPSSRRRRGGPLRGEENRKQTRGECKGRKGSKVERQETMKRERRPHPQSVVPLRSLDVVLCAAGSHGRLWSGREPSEQYFRNINLVVIDSVEGTDGRQVSFGRDDVKSPDASQREEQPCGMNEKDKETLARQTNKQTNKRQGLSRRRDVSRLRPSSGVRTAEGASLE